jgi:hypothetical protein
MPHSTNDIGFSHTAVQSLLKHYRVALVSKVTKALRSYLASPFCWQIAISLLVSNQVFAQQTVIYPRAESDTDVRSSFPMALLQKCEQQNSDIFTLKPSRVHTQQGRSLRQLAADKEMDVVWALTDRQREAALLPIRIPIDRGLIGWRLLLINTSKQHVFEQVSTAEQLRDLVAGQGHDWPDVEVLKANHFTVASSSTYQGLFHMLAREHIDYFPRAISEVWPELASNADLGLTVQSKLLIYYPSALYYFVNKKNVWLADTLEKCLSQATKDGSFKALFDEYYLDFILRADLKNRTIIRLTNPLLPASAPAIDSGYWFSPEEYY